MVNTTENISPIKNKNSNNNQDDSNNKLRNSAHVR